MTTGNTTLLGLALPVEGELDGTWGDVVNDSITSLVDSAVAGTTTLSTNADVTLTTTVLAANQARQAVILWTASNGATTRSITAPAQSKPYIVINAGTGSIVLRGAGPTTGVTIVSGEKCLAAWDGSDFVKVATSTTDGVSTISFGTTGLTPSTATAGAVTVAGTLAVANGGTGATSLTANNVILGNGTSAVQVVAPGTTGNVLTSDGTTWSSTAPAAGMVYPGAGVAVSTGTAWTTSLTAPSGALVGTTDTQTLTNKTLTDPSIVGTITEDIYALTDGATVDIDPGNGSIQTLTLTSTGRTLTFTNMVNGEAVTLMVNDGTAGTITTWNATFVNNGAVAPTLSTTGYTVVSIWKVASVVYAALVGNA